MTVLDKDEVFRRAVAAVLAQWTILNLAVEHSWGGRGPQRRRQDLYEWIVNTFSTSRVNSTWLAGELSLKLEGMFHVIAEDESDVEVAELLVALHASTRRGDFSLAKEILERHQSCAAAASVDGSRHRQPGALGEDVEGNAGHMSDSSSDQECDMEEDLAGLMANASMTPIGCDGPPATRTRSRTAAREAENARKGEPGEDEWIQVSRGNRRPRG
ncbi:pre-rRNA-processing protein TSR2 [Toxoplasma gondii TgCatPRC2]|uniref:Pre-rRNA-processing protein TSR2 n=5 Tax=Toxoplasma gondii TaxID=5811 RepID=A0A151HEW2_TOXGO|nr:hypothetical protein TGME49_237240 [Toxoplasma gondii ME49]KFG35782.1 pre-rRNA-processing protein TSR2 [Toxoplasma gondii GAB2-2007-GAL-DOM2]KYF43013.1 putative pre-rRNA-processing protein TSR2 [Toxoplasma gondii ARI]KYK67857.1 pre-rRNA-processing protein TSR2 [Toxoplasma gondii TgCatPRC2]PIL99358.1 putative pre-rRNA-processing protein TSR2 [Toxoplasma gondii COUG]EPT26604.1 hypothetical protein TGME49_237240 [Toxoplasma gondii ME49]|eukprot:XP_002369076.1 hypothetical protein TGME49_237240 [Toxoplasma gondii ME49]